MAVMGPRFTPWRAVMLVGAPGTVGVVIADEGTEPGPAPTALTACTTKLYVVPGARSLITWLLVGVVNVSVLITVAPTRTSIFEPVIGEPPSLAGAFHVTVL